MGARWMAAFAKGPITFQWHTTDGFHSHLELRVIYQFFSNSCTSPNSPRSLLYKIGTTVRWGRVFRGCGIGLLDKNVIKSKEITCYYYCICILWLHSVLFHWTAYGSDVKAVDQFGCQTVWSLSVVLSAILTTSFTIWFEIRFDTR